MNSGLNYGSFVSFITADSLEFLEGITKRLISFFGGNHSPAAVHQQIPAALKLLNTNDVIMLHDFFPNLKPLWSNGSIIKGPLIVTERLKEEGADFNSSTIRQITLNDKT